MLGSKYACRKLEIIIYQFQYLLNFLYVLSVRTEKTALAVAYHFSEIDDDVRHRLNRLRYMKT